MDIVLLTIGYPYPKKDVFVANEINYLSERFDNVWIVPVFEGKLYPSKKYQGELPELPKNVHVNKLEYGITDALWINPKIMIEMVKELNWNMKDNLKVLLWGLHGSVTLNYLQRFIKKNGLDPSRTVLYSFWFHFNALAISCLKDNFALKISRAHRYDLYKEIGAQPFKSFILNKLNMVFACSNMGKDYLNNEYNSTKSHLSYLGTSNIQASQFVFPIREGIFSIVSCSRVTDVKRIHKIVEGLEKIKDLSIEWTHIGDGPLFTDIQNLVSRKLSDHKNIKVNFVGSLSNKQVLQYYQSHNINLFVNVSRSEGLPVSIMEAQSFGIPVMATNVGGVNEIIDHSMNGYLLDVDFDEQQFKNYITEVVNMPNDIYENFCKDSRRKWEETFNAEKNYHEFIKVLESNINQIQMGIDVYA